jgi:hypothetical protein
MRNVHVILVAAVGVLLACAPSASAASCSVRGKERKLGATYVMSLSVSGVSCARGERVVKAFHRCRRADGGADGRCGRRVLGYRCSERRSDEIPTQYSGRVTCKAGSKRVVHRYTQYT